jgi:hypothetical protein
MKNVMSVIFIVMFLTTGTSFAQVFIDELDGSTLGISDESDGATWVQKSTFPSIGQSEPLSFSIYDKGYIGITSDMVDNTGEFWEFDPKSNLWKRKADLPTDGFLFQSPHFVICDKAYIVIGNHLWQYDQVLNKWSRKSDVPGEDKRAAFGFSIGSKGYIGGGFYNGTSLWEYDAFLDQWKQKKDHPVLGYGCNQGYETCSMGGISFTIKNKAYVTGTNMYFWEYNPYQDIWTKKEYVDAVYGQAFAIGNKGYVYNTDGVFYEYDYESNLWEQKESLPGNLMCYPGGFAIDGKGYIGVGGLFENNTCTLTANNKLWEFTPTNTTNDKCDESYSAGKQACIDNPASCGIDINGSATPATISADLDLHIPQLNYVSPSGTMNLWVDFEYVGENKGDLLWKLSDFGQK